MRTSGSKQNHCRCSSLQPREHGKGEDQGLLPPAPKAQNQKGHAEGQHSVCTQGFHQGTANGPHPSAPWFAPSPIPMSSPDCSTLLPIYPSCIFQGSAKLYAQLLIINQNCKNKGMNKTCAVRAESTLSLLALQSLAPFPPSCLHFGSNLNFIFRNAWPKFLNSH